MVRERMDVPPMIFTGNPLIIKPGMVFFMHMILMDSEAQLAMNLGETYLVTETGNERFKETEARSGHIVELATSLMTSHKYCLYVGINSENFINHFRIGLQILKQTWRIRIIQRY